jgi:hypothetical protein
VCDGDGTQSCFKLNWLSTLHENDLLEMQKIEPNMRFYQKK